MPSRQRRSHRRQTSQPGEVRGAHRHAHATVTIATNRNRWPLLLDGNYSRSSRSRGGIPAELPRPGMQRAAPTECAPTAHGQRQPGGRSITHGNADCVRGARARCARGPHRRIGSPTNRGAARLPASAPTFSSMCHLSRHDDLPAVRGELLTPAPSAVLFGRVSGGRAGEGESNATHPSSYRGPSPGRTITVYECDSSSARSLDEQHSAGCTTFMRRAGIGGSCPCSNEPVTVT